jgi:hypothetical protein
MHGRLALTRQKALPPGGFASCKTGVKNKNLQTSQTRNGGKFNDPAKKQFWRTGLILLFAEKLAELFGPDEWKSNRCPGSGIQPHSAFPALRPVALEFVAVTVAQPHRILTGFPDI